MQIVGKKLEVSPAVFLDIGMIAVGVASVRTRQDGGETAEQACWRGQSGRAGGSP